MSFKLVSLSIFSWTQWNLNLEINKNLNFNGFLWQTIFEIFQVWMNNEILEGIPPYISFLKQLKAVHPSFVTITKPLGNKIGKAFYPGLKWMCKCFEKNGQKDSWKPVILSKSSKHFIIELALGNSYRFCLAAFLQSGILSLFQELCHLVHSLLETR